MCDLILVMMYLVLFSPFIIILLCVCSGKVIHVFNRVGAFLERRLVKWNQEPWSFWPYD